MRFTALLLCLAFTATAQTALPRRIISAAPSATEILYGVGAFDRVVAVSRYGTYPPQVKNLPRVGGWQDTSLEKIAALRPDLVVLTDAQAPLFGPEVKALGIRMLVAPSQTLEDAFKAMELIGHATGNDARARELERSTRAALDQVRNRTRNLSRPRVLLVVDRTPGTLRDLYAATKGSFLEQLIEIAGGESVAAPAHLGYGRISTEAVLSLNPEIILDMARSSKDDMGSDSEAAWSELPELRAVRERRVYAIHNAFVTHDSQFVAGTAKLLAHFIHPEAFPGVRR